MSGSETVLVVDDSAATVEVLTRNLEGHGLTVRSAGDVDAARRCLESEAVDLVVTDLKMPGESGIELVRHVRTHHPDVGVVMITGYPSIETAVEAVKSGAEEYLAKPFTDDELSAVVERALEGVRRRRRSEGGIQRLGALVTDAPEMAGVVRAVDRAAQSIEPVLVVGPPGSGRGACARAIHDRSARHGHPFIPVSCAAGGEEDLRAQLLGGSGPPPWTGLIERADGGSLLLEEVDRLPAELQVALLRVLNERAVPPPQGGRSRAVDVRFLATSRSDLGPRCSAGSFRRDLAVRLGATTVVVPPLSRRTGDPSLMAADLVARWCARDGRASVSLSRAAAEALDRWPWPGGLPELERATQVAYERAAGGSIDAAHLPEEVRSEASAGTEPRSLAEVEASHIRRVLERVGGNKSEAARLLGIDRKTLRDRLRRRGGSTAAPGGRGRGET